MATTFWRNRDYQNKVIQALEEMPNIIVFDTETTGFSASKERIIEFAAIRFRVGDGSMLEEVDSLHLYMRPPFAVPEVITSLTGITTEFLADKPYEEECANLIRNYIGDQPQVICAHNAKFDMSFLKEFYARNNLGSTDHLIPLDTLEMARDIFSPSDVKGYKLGDLAEACGISDGVQFHSAIEDVRVTAKILQICYLEYLSRHIEADANGGIRPRVTAINFWEGYKGHSRIYVDTEEGSLYFDVWRKQWLSKNADLEKLDLSFIEKCCWEATNSSDASQFAKFTGRIKLYA